MISSAKGRQKELSMYAKAATSDDMKQWTAMSDDQRRDAKNGRSWRAEELRLKNHGDLHKLWYVLLKEKNKLKSDYLMCKQLGQIYFGHNDLKKVKLSMTRLLTVVNERKRLRSLYRMHLEDEYIKKQKEREFNEFLVNRDEMVAKGIKNVPLTKAEVAQLLREKDEKKAARMMVEREKISESIKEGQ